MKILFVCHGNICRSPLAEILFAGLVRDEGLDVTVDSAGTSGLHLGEQAHRLSRACASRHGFELTHLSRQVSASDFQTFDFLIAMDQENVADLRRRSPEHSGKIHMMRDWDPAGRGDVPDPYYGDESDFEHVWHLCERSAPGLLHEVRQRMKR